MTQLDAFGTVELDAFDELGDFVKTEEMNVLLSEIKEHSIRYGDAHLAVPAVLLLLSHPHKGIYVVRRADKSENPHLWCKTVGGHIHHGESPEDALVRESYEEIRTDIVIAGSFDEYENLLSTVDLSSRAVVRKVDFKPWFRTDRIDRETGRPWRRRFRAHIYAGRLEKESLEFTGRTSAPEFRDGLGEAVSYAFYGKEELGRILAEGDRRFTHDLTVLFRDYATFL